MSDMPDPFKILLNKKPDELLRVPSLNQSLDDLEKGIQSKDSLFPLAFSVATNEDKKISEQERSLGIHVVGSTREGKSKFLEHIVRHDIDRLAEDERKIVKKQITKRDRRSLGLLYIDPSAQGDSADNILNYCAEIGFNKVILIDPHRIEQHDRIPPINPLYMPIRRLTESFRVTFGVNDANKIANIETYLRAIFNIVRSLGLTLIDVHAFTVVPGDERYEEFSSQRRLILDRAKALVRSDKLHFAKRRILEKNIYEVEQAYRNYTAWRSEIASTVRRLNVVFQSEISQLLYGHRDGLDFMDLVSDGWVILVVVSDEHLDDLESRLLATLTINNVVYAIERIRRKGFDKPYHMFIDEVGEYATSQLRKMLDLKQKMLIWPVLAHQHLSQLEDKKIADAVENGAKIKAAFYIEKPTEREAVLRLLGYGGDLTPQEVAWALRDQPKQQMVLKIGKTDPVVCEAFDIVSPKKNEAFIKQHILSSGNYVSEAEIEQDYVQRLGHKQTNTKSARSSRPPDRKAANGNDVPPGLQARRASQKGEVRTEPSLSESNESSETSGKGRSRKF